MCCGATQRNGCVIGCPNGCSFDWCWDCQKCPRHCKCVGGPKSMCEEVERPASEHQVK